MSHAVFHLTLLVLAPGPVDASPPVNAAQPRPADALLGGPQLREPHSAIVFDELRGRFVFFGGPSGGETWKGDGLNWELDDSPGPSPRLYFPMTFDSARGVVVLFGGRSLHREGGALHSDTWEWNGRTWSQVNTEGPPPRCCHEMAYDSAHAVTVLFGGHTEGGELLGDTWEWDGQRWSLRNDSGPSPRVGHAMTFDKRRGRLLLWGGIDRRNFDIYQTGTWEWNGWNWTQRPGEEPPSRYAHTAYFDDRRGFAVVLGGYGLGDVELSDAWEWDGAAWQRSNVVPGLPKNEVAHLAFDPRRGTVVAFERPIVSGLPLGDAWQLGQPSWIRMSPP